MVSRMSKIVEAAVTSGVPQGAVIGPKFFFIDINEVQSRISPAMELFVDHSVICWDLSLFTADLDA